MIAKQVGIPNAAVYAAVLSETPSDTAPIEQSWARLPSEIVDGGEMIVMAIKPSMWRPLFESAPWLILATVLSAMLVGLGKPIIGLSITMSVQIVLVLGVARLAIAIVRWVPTWYVLTNRRVMCIHGVRAPQIRACALVDVRNTYVNASPPEKLTRLGTIAFVSHEADHAPLLWLSVARPGETHEKVRRAIENAIDRQGL